MRSHIYWIVIHDSTQARCLRCGSYEALPKLPVSVSEWATEMDWIINQHSHCKAPNFTEEGKRWALTLVRTDSTAPDILDSHMAVGHEWISAAFGKLLEMADAYYTGTNEDERKMRTSLAEALAVSFAKFRKDILGETL